MNENIKNYNLSVIKGVEAIDQLNIAVDLNSNDIYKTKVIGVLDKVYLGNDYFDVFLKIRADLEKLSLFLASKGCLKNVMPSGMSRDWSEGLTAYQLDEATLESTQVDIYAPVFESEYQNLCSYIQQVEYKKAFMKKNKERFIERNKKLEIDLKKKYGY